MEVDARSGGGMPLPATNSSGKAPKVNKLRRVTPAARFVKTGPEPLIANDFGVEIGGSSEFYNLPRTIRGGGGKIVRRLCVSSRERRSLFRHRGKDRFDTDHDLCFRCHRAAMDRSLAIRLSETAEVHHG